MAAIATSVRCPTWLAGQTTISAAFSQILATRGHANDVYTLYRTHTHKFAGPLHVQYGVYSAAPVLCVYTSRRTFPPHMGYQKRTSIKPRWRPLQASGTRPKSSLATVLSRLDPNSINDPFPLSFSRQARQGCGCTPRSFMTRPHAIWTPREEPRCSAPTYRSLSSPARFAVIDRGHQYQVDPRSGRRSLESRY